MIRSPNDTVSIAVADGVCTVTLSRPQSLNAIDGDMAAALHAVTEAAAGDAAVRCVLVRGAGDHFMAGGDIAAFRAWLAEMHLRVDDAGQDSEAVGVDGVGRIRCGQVADGSDTAISNADVALTDPVLVDDIAAAENEVEGAVHVIPGGRKGR